MGQELLKRDYIQADETPVDVQMHDGRGKNHQPYVWQYSRPDGLVVFDFRMGREREGPKRFLGNFEGYFKVMVTGIRSCRRSRNRPCSLLGACQAKVFRGAQNQPQGSRLDRDRGADG